MGSVPIALALVELPAARVVRVVPKNFALARGGQAFLLDAEQHGNVLVAVQAVRDEERHDEHVRAACELIPLRDERRLSL